MNPGWFPSSSGTRTQNLVLELRKWEVFKESLVKGGSLAPGMTRVQGPEHDATWAGSYRYFIWG